ncbi:MAG: InlB B-repeat-containing protein [Clostridia bacterium]|nr:InlB B-repeat-containing protein [Clostridia bacterium]
MTTDGTYNTTPDKSWTVDSFTDEAVSYNIYSTETLLTGFTANEDISTLTGTVPGEGMLTLVAKYDRKQYTLTVNGCEGVTAATGEFTYYYDKEIVVDATVATGYTWVEWQSADETALAGSADKKYIFNMPANDAELTAVATLDVYGITYDLAGGALAEGVTNPASYSVTTETFTLNNPTKVGYDFIGWTGTDLATPTVTVTVEKNSTTGDKSYTANWKAIEYTVSYDLDGGTAQGNNYTKYTIESEAQTLTAPAKLGYTFLGWTGSNGTEPKKDITIAGGTIGDLSFTANWSADAHTYTVEYRTMTTEGVYAEQPDKTETIDSYTDAEVSVAVTPDEGFYIADTSILSGTVKHDNSLVLKVYIGRYQYDVTLVDGGDGISSVNTNTTRVYFDAPVEVNAVVENGYTFEKWTSADTAVLAGSENNPYTFNMPAGNVTLTASATLNRYHINYTMNGGTNNAANPTTYTVLDAVNIKQPTRLGYTFTGWSGSYYGKNVYIAAGNTGDINLTANWSINTYTVSYDLAGGTLADGQNNPTSYNVTESFTLYNPTKVGYDFVGWKGTGIDGTQENVTVAEGTTGDLAFTAVWTARPDTKYTVNYYLENVNGDQTYTLSADSFVGEYYSDQNITPAVPVYTGFATPVAQTKVVNADGTTVFNFYYECNIYTYTFKAIGYEDDVYKYYYEYPVAKPADPTRKGYTFEGWNPVVYATMPAFDVTAEAQWKAITYTVGYDLAGGTVSGNPTEYTVEQSFTLVNPTRVGYDFAGWTGTGLDEAALNVTVDAGSIGNRSYTATWTPVRYEITYDFAGGTDNGVNPISYTIEDSITLVNPTKVGYTFSGWKGTGIAGTSMVVSFRNSTGDRNYTASWRANNNTLYTVLHYQQDIGANTYSLFETEELHGTTLAEVSPNVKTYPGFTSPSRKTVTILPDGSATLEYYYTRNTYTIFFDSNGGTAVSSKTFAFGETLSGIETPSYLGYTFAGWTPALPETMTAGNLYVTADWKPNTDTPYTVYHYFQDVDCISYPDELMKVEYCYGETGAIVEVATWDVEGFTAPEKRSIVIAADGSRTVRYYYTRNTYTVTFVDHNDQILDMQSVVYGLPATPPALEDRAPDADGHYTFIGWSEDVNFIHGYTTIKAMYSSEAHNPGAEADCTNALVCTVCGYEIAPANGHMPVVQTPAKEPTCTEPGNTADSVCSVCGEVLSRYSILAPLGHEIGSWYVDVPATATTTGILKRACSRCDWYETHEIPVLSDTPVVSIDITTQGSQAYVGTSYQLVTEILPANAGNKQVIWESSDPSIATVTPEGFVTSHKPGEVTFTVITLDGLKTDSITINFYYAADHFNILLLDVFGCEVYLDGKMIDETVEFVRVKAGSTLAFTLKPTTDEYLEQGGYILTANGSNVKPDANGVYYIYNVHENIEISALPVIGKPEFDEDQNYDTDEVPEKSIFAKLLEFFEKIAAFFRKLFGMD